MNQLEQAIGDAAGKIWSTLDMGGSMTRTQLGKKTGLPAPLLNQGIGWLAREGKLQVIQDKKREVLELNNK
jgi:hypothetical protein